MKYSKIRQFADDANLLCLSNYQKTEQTRHFRLKASS